MCHGIFEYCVHIQIPPLQKLRALKISDCEMMEFDWGILSKARDLVDQMELIISVWKSLFSSIFLFKFFFSERI
jgi:hypothetical protein